MRIIEIRLKLAQVLTIKTSLPLLNTLFILMLQH
jgi:hypothetical protein